MKRVFIAAFLFLWPCIAGAEWKVERGTKVGSLRNHQVGIIATLPATATFDGVSAYLQVECLEHPEVTTRIVNIVTSKDTAPRPSVPDTASARQPVTRSNVGGNPPCPVEGQGLVRLAALTDLSRGTGKPRHQIVPKVEGTITARELEPEHSSKKAYAAHSGRINIS